MKQRLIVGILTPLRGNPVLLYLSGGTVYRADTGTPVCYRAKLQDFANLSCRVQPIRPQWRALATLPTYPEVL